MLETPHVVVGVAIATKIPNPLIAIPLALASHFLLDRVPHWNPHLNQEIKVYGKVSRKSTYLIAADVVLAVVIGGIVAYGALPDTLHAFYILLAGFAAVLPDVIEGPYFFLGWKNKIIKKWIAFQKSIQVDTSVVPGLTTQLATILASLLWIYR